MNTYEFHKIPSKSHDFVKKKHHLLVMTNSLLLKIAIEIVDLPINDGDFL